MGLEKQKDDENETWNERAQLERCSGQWKEKRQLPSDKNKQKMCLYRKGKTWKLRYERKLANIV